MTNSPTPNWVPTTPTWATSTKTDLGNQFQTDDMIEFRHVLTSPMLVGTFVVVYEQHAPDGPFQRGISVDMAVDDYMTAGETLELSNLLRDATESLINAGGAFTRDPVLVKNSAAGPSTPMIPGAAR